MQDVEQFIKLGGELVQEIDIRKMRSCRAHSYHFECNKRRFQDFPILLNLSIYSIIWQYQLCSVSDWKSFNGTNMVIEISYVQCKKKINSIKSEHIP